MTFPAPIFAAWKHRIFLAKIVHIPPEGYSKWQLYLSFAIVAWKEREIMYQAETGKQENSTIGKALIAMSGGVDSSMAAALMQEKGYSCIGVTMKLYQNEDIVSCPQGDTVCSADVDPCCTVSDDMLPGYPEDLSDSRTCCSLEDAEDAAAVARKLKMPFYVFNFTDDFRCKVMDRFVNCYLKGETPNPCIDCNRYMKFEKLYERARMLGCDQIATGHYVRTGWNEKTGRWQMRIAADRSKDQSYVLYSLSQEQLAHTCFPLGGMTKAQVRELAAEYGFSNAGKRDSQDICFVPDGHYGKFIEHYLGRKLPEGNFVTEDGKVLGKHKGIIYYTVGQRKGLGIAAEYPYYVKEIRPETNEVVLCPHEGLFQSTLFARDMNWVSVAEPAGKIRAQAKIRYRHVAQPGEAEVLGNGLLRFTFDEPQRAVTKGQSLVLYDGELVLGGGIICGEPL